MPVRSGGVVDVGPFLFVSSPEPLRREEPVTRWTATPPAGLALRETKMSAFVHVPCWVLFAAENAAENAAAADETGGIWSMLAGPMFPLIAIFVLFYFMLIRPERRRKATLSQMLDNLKKNDRVVTVGGIVGTVVNVQKGSEEVTIKVDESTNTKLRVIRSSIGRVLGDETGDLKKDVGK
jgi:preprotein translocase subunit YajC